MSGRRESGRDLYIDPASLAAQRGSLDLSITGQDFDLNNSLAFTDSLSTISNSGSQNRILHRLSPIDPSLLEDLPNIHHPQYGAVSYSSPLDFRRPDLPHDLKNPFQVEHGSSVPDADPWTSVAVVNQSMSDSKERLIGSTQQSKQKLLTDSGYASSSKSNQYASSQSYMASYSTDGQLTNTESREDRMQQVLPDQASAYPQRTPHNRSKAKSVTSLSDNFLDTDQLACDICALKFSTKSEYTKHMARHEKKFKCSESGCKKTDGFATQNDLDRHLRSVHHLLDPDAPVWKCFIDGCKSAEKMWPRRDNFKAHIERMHKGEDVDEYMRRSAQWFDEEEKPRRQARSQPPLEDPLFATNTGARSMDLNAGNNQHYPVNMSALSPNDRMNSRHSIAGEFPYSSPGPYPAFDNVSGPGSQLNTQPYLQSRPSHVLPNQFHNVGRSFSNNANASASNATTSTGQYYQAASIIPAIRTDDMHDNFGDNIFYSSNTPAWDSKTMPEIGHFNNDDFPTNYSPDNDKHAGEEMLPLTQADSNMFSFMGPSDDSSLPAPNAIPQHITDLPGQPAPIQSITSVPDDDDDDEHDRAEEIRRTVAEAMSKIHGADEELAQKLAKVVREHSSSRASTGGKEISISGDVEVEKPFACDWRDCGKRFAKKNVCAKHRKRHDKRWFCTFDGCYKRFGSKQDMQRHEVTCSTQEEGWRCWCPPKSRATNKGCAMFCTDAKTFEKHCKEEHHGYSRRSTDEFKIERDFTGPFWCGFCNSVIPNPVVGGYDGSARLKYRYDHIDKHLNENKTMADWYDLKGEGMTKGEKRDSLKKIIKVTTNDEDEDEADEDELDNNQPPPASSSGSRRQRSETLPGSRPQFLAPPSSGSSQGLKRALPEGLTYGRDYQNQKMPRLQQSQSSSRFSMPFVRSTAGMVVTARPDDSKAAWISCCMCQSRPTPYNGQKQCTNPNCGHLVCTSCSYWNRNTKQIFPPQNVN